MTHDALHICADMTLRLGRAGDEVSVLVAGVEALMSDDGARQAAIAACSPQRREHALRLRATRSQALSVGATLLLDELLRRHSLRERDMTYTIGPHGKPAFAACKQIAFSLSHSGTMAAAACLAVSPTDVARTGLGIDIERKGRYRTELVRRMFAPADRLRMASARTEEQRQAIFADVWTRTEAYAKATGRGLTWPVQVPPPEACFHSCDAPDGYRLCVCLCMCEQGVTITM